MKKWFIFYAKNIKMLKRLNLPKYNFKIKEENNKPYIFDRVRKKYIVLTPEEWVRQNFVEFLVNEKKYPLSLIAIEKKLDFGYKFFRWDIVVFDKYAKPYMLVECKAPDINISQNSYDQAIIYNSRLKVKFIVISNGLKHFCYNIDYLNKRFEELKEIPECDF
jgi:hypothetical protein